MRTLWGKVLALAWLCAIAPTVAAQVADGDAGAPRVPAGAPPALAPAHSAPQGQAPVPQGAAPQAAATPAAFGQLPAVPWSVVAAPVVSVTTSAQGVAGGSLLYQVVYEYAGQRYTAMLPYHPGALLQVQLSPVVSGPTVAQPGALVPVIVLGGPDHQRLPDWSPAPFVLGVRAPWGRHWRGWRSHRHW